tara:strand:+ start:159 stop:914 length:756 start_codon:yes stop_codon:yes gene_type:complete
MFDEKTKKELKSYVYLLINPDTKTPFYVGKGIGNRVFNHLMDAKDGKVGTEKLDHIQSILKKHKSVEHVIVRHGLNEKTAFQIEAALIDTFRFIPTFNEFVSGNIQGGMNSIENGLMSSEEVKRKYNALPLNSIPNTTIIININGSYKKASGTDKIYMATKERWRMKDPRAGQIKYVLSEYKGLIVEVFEVNKWYAIQRQYNPGSKKSGQTYIGYGFDGEVALNKVRNLYINKSVAHKKKRGASNPIIYNL